MCLQESKDWPQTPKIVPFVTNCCNEVDAPAKDQTGNNLPAVVPNYREVSRTVDGANRRALQMRQVGRQIAWSYAMCAFMLCYADGNASATCKASGLVDENTTM